MNQQAFNLLGAFLAIGAIAGIWFYFAEDDALGESEPPQIGQQASETQRQRASETQRQRTSAAPRGGSLAVTQRYRVDYPGLVRWFEAQPEIVVTARPDAEINAIGSRQDALLALLLGGFSAGKSPADDHISHLQGIVLNPGGAGSVSWRPIIGNNPPVHPVALAHELLPLSPQESMADEFKRIIRFASSSSLDSTISDIDSRIVRWRKFHADNPSDNNSLNNQNSRYLNAMAMMSKLLQYYQSRSGESLSIQLTPDEARQRWATFEANDLPRLADFVRSSTVETIPLFDGKTFDTAYTPVNHHFFLRGSIHGRTVFIQIMPENSSLIESAGLQD